jgi:biopolymer transport protein ExbB
MHQTDEFSVINAFLSFAEMGAEWVMWLMIGLGFLAVVIAVERARLYTRTKIDAPSMGRDLVGLLNEGAIEDAQARFARGVAMEERVLADALAAWPQGLQAVEQTMMSAMAREKQRYNRFLSYFGTVGNNAPFIGLFGTVIGIILAFKELGANPQGGLEVVGPSIAEALVATAVGLMVAIPAVVIFNYCKQVVKTRVGNTDFLSRLVLARLGKEA